MPGFLTLLNMSLAKKGDTVPESFEEDVISGGRAPDRLRMERRHASVQFGQNWHGDNVTAALNP